MDTSFQFCMKSWQKNCVTLDGPESLTSCVTPFLKLHFKSQDFLKMCGRGCTTSQQDVFSDTSQQAKSVHPRLRCSSSFHLDVRWMLACMQKFHISTKWSWQICWVNTLPCTNVEHFVFAVTQCKLFQHLRVFVRLMNRLWRREDGVLLYKADKLIFKLKCAILKSTIWVWQKQLTGWCWLWRVHWVFVGGLDIISFSAMFKYTSAHMYSYMETHRHAHTYTQSNAGHQTDSLGRGGACHVEWISLKLCPRSHFDGQRGVSHLPTRLAETGAPSFLSAPWEPAAYQVGPG